MLSLLKGGCKAMCERKQSRRPASDSRTDFPPAVPLNTFVCAYATFTLLCRIRHESGLEAMLEYVDRYQLLAERYAPNMCIRIREHASRIDLSTLFIQSLQ
jgi:hypothetical protein